MAELTIEQQRALALARARLRAANAEPAAPEQVERGALRAVGQGATFGFADEIASAAAAAAAAVANPTDDPRGFWERFKAAYEDISANEREQLAAYREQNPGKALGAEIAGGLMTGGAVGTRAFQAMRGASPLARTAIPGAAEGAVYGLGAADPGERVSGAATGAAIGGVAAPAAQLVGNVVAKPAARAFRSVAERATGTPAQQAQRMVRGAGAADDLIDPAAVRARAAELGPDATLADLGPNLAMQAEGAANQVGPARRVISEALDARQAGQQSRLLGAAGRNAGALSDDFYGTLESLSQQAKAAAEPLYRSAYSAEIMPDRQLISLMKHPLVREAIPKARRLLGDKLKFGVEYLDGIKRALDDKISSALRNGNNNEARVAIKLKNELVDWVDSRVPDYAKARSAYAGFASREAAADLGREFVTKKIYAPDVVRATRRMTESELDAMRMGVLRGIADTIEDTGANQNAANRLLRTTRMRNVIKALFPDEASFDRFVKQADAESLFSQRRNEIIGGSPTGRRLAAQEAVNQTADAAGQAASGNYIGGLFSLLGKFFKNDTPPEVLEEVAKLLVKPFRDITDDELRTIFRNVPKGSTGVSIAASPAAVATQQAFEE